MANYNYTIKIGNTTFDLTALKLVDSTQNPIVKPMFTTEFKSATGTLTLVLLPYRNISAYSSLVESIIAARDNDNAYDILVTRTKDNVIDFRGYMQDSDLTLSSSKVPESLSLSARDKSILLDTKYRSNRIFENVARNTAITNLMTDLSSELGFTVSVSSTELDDSRIIANWCVTEDDNRTYRDIIDTILYEAGGYVIVYDSLSDTFKIKEIPKIYTLASLDEVTYKISDKLTTTSRVYAYDGILLKYPTIETKADQSIYTEAINPKIESGVLTGDTIEPYACYPTDGDITPTYQEFTAKGLDRAYITKQTRIQNEDLALVYVKPSPAPTISIQCDKTLSKPTNCASGWTDDTFYPKKAWVLRQNQTSSNANITVFSITGTVVYRSKINQLTYGGSNSSICKNPEEYETETLDSNNENGLAIQRFVEWLYNAKKFSCVVTTWTEVVGRNATSTLGKIVNVKHKSETNGLPHVVAQIQETIQNGIEMHKVTAVSISGYKLYSEVAKEVQVSLGGVRGEKGEDGTDGQSIVWKGSLYAHPANPQNLWAYYNLIYGKTYIYNGSSWQVMAQDGTTGKGISSVTAYYAVSTTQTKPAASEITSTTIPEMSPTNKYLWKKEVTTYSDGTTSYIITLESVYGDQGEDAQIFELLLSSDTVKRNLRNSNSQSITVKTQISGYTGTLSVTVSHGTFTANSEGTGGTWTLPYIISSNPATVQISASYGDAPTQTRTLNVIDITSEPMYLAPNYVNGHQVLPTVSSDGNIITGDYFVAFETFSGYSAGVCYKYNGSSWIEMTASNSSAEQFLICMNELKNAGTDFNTINNANSVSWFKSIIADSLIANQIKAVTGFFDNITIGNSATFQGSITSDAISTVPASESDTTGKTVTPSHYSIGDLLTSTNLPNNTMVDITNGTYNGSTITKAIKVTDTSTILTETKTGSHSYSHSVSSTIEETEYIITVDSPSAATDVTLTFQRQRNISDDSRIYIYDSALPSYHPAEHYYDDSVEVPQYGTLTQTLQKSNGSQIYLKPIRDNDYSYRWNAWGAGMDITYSYTKYTALSYLGINSTGLWVYNGSTWTKVGDSSTCISSGTALAFTYSGTTYNSANNINYSDITNFINYTSFSITGGTQAVSLGIPYRLQAIALTIKGVSKTPVYFKRDTTTQVTITCTDGTVHTYKSGVYGYISGTIKIDGSAAGVELGGQYPKNSSVDIGTSTKYWRDGYIKVLHPIMTPANDSQYSSGSAVVTSSYIASDGSAWYRIWSDGWVEQGGFVSSSAEANVTFPTPFANTNYRFIANLVGTDGAYINRCTLTISTKTTTTIHIDYKSVTTEGSNGTATGYDWYACGY